MLRGFVVRQVVQQNGAENGTFGFHVGGKTVRETVVGSSQGLTYLLGKSGSKCDRDTSRKLLVDALRRLRKTGTRLTFFGRIVAQTAKRLPSIFDDVSMENKKRNIKTVVDTRTSIRTPIPLMGFLMDLC